MFFLYLVISGALIGIDQWVKAWTYSNFDLGETQTVINGLFSLTFVKNTGAAWSILEGKMVFFAVITVVAVAVIGYFLFKHAKDSKWLGFGLSLALAGAIGNFIDRMSRGYVVDMFQFDFINFPIFNVADIALVVGVACIFIYMILDERAKKK